MKKKRDWTWISGGLYFTAVICTVLLLLVLVTGRSGQTAPMMRVEGIGAGDCKGCHGNLRVQPPDHVETKDMEAAGCGKCHPEGLKGLRTKIPLGHIHILKGISCGDCHDGPKEAKPLSTAECLACHNSSEKVAEKTGARDPNPHNSPHYGTTLDCDLCHRQHGKSENFCAQCHEWELRVP